MTTGPAGDAAAFCVMTGSLSELTRLIEAAPAAIELF